MSNIIPFESANLPAHLQDTQGVDKAWDEVGSGGFPRLKMKGMTLEASINGSVVAATEPGHPVRVVLLKPSKLGRTFYEGQYEEGSKDLPTCYSLDNVSPAPDAQKPQCSTCALCPMNVKGSGAVKDTKACRYRQTLAVWVPGDATDEMIFQVNLPATSIFPDEENKQGFMPLQRYVRKLKAARIDPSKIWTDLVVDGYADPKRILLKPVGYIEDPQDYELVKQHLASPELERILNTGPLDGEQVAAGEFGEMPDHLKPQAAHKPVVPQGSQDTVNPFTGEIIYTDDPVSDNIDTYWKDEETGEVVKLVAGTNLPVEYPGIVEVEQAAYDAYLAELAAKREAEERARREAEELARLAAEQIAAAGRSRSRSRGTAQPETPVAEQPAATSRRSRGAATQTVQQEVQQPAPAAAGGRRRAAAAVQTEQTVQTEQPVQEQPAATATGTSRRRAVAATAANTAADTNTSTAEPTSRRRSGAVAAAQAAAADAPEDEQPRVVNDDAGLDPAMASALDAALGSMD